MNNKCFNIKKINMKNSIASCDPNNSNIEECRKLNTCDYNKNCYFFTPCLLSDFKIGNCFRNCDTERDNDCYLRDFCGHSKTNMIIKSNILSSSIQS